MVMSLKDRVNDDDNGVSYRGPPGKEALGQLLESMRSYYEWAREGTRSILERALEYLQPRSGERPLCPQLG